MDSNADLTQLSDSWAVATWIVARFIAKFSIQETAQVEDFMKTQIPVAPTGTNAPRAHIKEKRSTTYE
jgi:hypothetical protein